MLKKKKKVEPHHLTLDMCAAPGSKTTQMLEVMQQHRSPAAATTTTAATVEGEPVGLVMANDSDTQRAYMLAHQCHRVNSPALVITTHMGQVGRCWVGCGRAFKKMKREINFDGKRKIFSRTQHPPKSGMGSLMS